MINIGYLQYAIGQKRNMSKQGVKTQGVKTPCFQYSGVHRREMPSDAGNNGACSIVLICIGVKSLVSVKRECTV